MHEARWTQPDSTTVTPCRNSNIGAEWLDDEAILIDPRTGQIHRLNKTAAAVWSSCDGHTTARQIAAQMTELYDVEYEYALDYTYQLISMFAESNLLELEADV